MCCNYKNLLPLYLSSNLYESLLCYAKRSKIRIPVLFALADYETHFLLEFSKVDFPSFSLAKHLLKESEKDNSSVGGLGKSLDFDLEQRELDAESAVQRIVYVDEPEL